MRTRTSQDKEIVEQSLFPLVVLIAVFGVIMGTKQAKNGE
jgi:hypothetical protein